MPLSVLEELHLNKDIKKIHLLRAFYFLNMIYSALPAISQLILTASSEVAASITSVVQMREQRL